MFRGSVVALITPFSDGAVDHAALARLVEWQIEQGTHGLVPCGTTGETPALRPEEYEAVIATVVRVVRGRVPVIAGAGANSTEHAVHLSRAAERLGADALLHVTPYYNKPTQAGLAAHYRAVAAATPLPVLLYNVPGRTGVNLMPETVARLADVPNVVGIKEAGGNLDQVTQLRRLCGPDFTILSGDDSLTLPMLALGARGVISVVANAAPALMAGLVNAWEAGDVAEARRLHLAAFPLARALFAETSPGPVKYAAEVLGLCRAELRLPLVGIEEATRARVRAALTDAGLAAVRAGVPA